MGKVVSQSDLILHRSQWKRNGKRVVFVSGAFDLLHPGHVRLLEQARELGDVLVVGVASDAAVRRLWNAENASPNEPARPVTPAAERMEILAALAAVDFVVEYEEPVPSKLASRLEPDVIAEGAAPTSVSSSTRMEPAATGDSRRPIPLEPGYSTSELIKRIKQLHA
ncbi:MAG TPA: adenylyltransferase/cytidyltransferase family protein [Candidatus Sulfotelmatobacter sp.]|nr:adenylyltransferase/cytidyltransferase family protein [Candidatus Sulfotelmatobacter sp.]